MPRFASPARCVFHVRSGDPVPKQRLEEGRAPVRVHGLAVKERQAGDPAEQREVRQVVCARGGGAVRVGLKRAASVLAQEQPAVQKQHLVEGLPEPLAAQPVSRAVLAVKPHVDPAGLRRDAAR